MLKEERAPGGVLNRNLGRGVRPTQRNPVEDTKDVNFATLPKRTCCNFLPCSRLDQAVRIKNTKNDTYKFAFSRISTKVHEISENYLIEGEQPCLRSENVKLYTLFKTEDPENDTLTVGTSLYRKYMGVLPPPGTGDVLPSWTSTPSPIPDKDTAVVIIIIVEA